MPEDEFIEIDLELGLTYSVIGANQPLLKISDGPVGEWNRRLRALSEGGLQWLSTGDMFEPSSRQAREALKAIGVNGRTWRHILLEERDDSVALEIWDDFHADAT